MTGAALLRNCARLSEAMAYLGFHLKMSTPSNVDA
jgi:hypothetical protein